MSSRISQWIGLIGIAATIPLVQTVAVAKSPVEIARIAKEVTVLITSSKGQGSGVILQQQGDVYTVLTAAHVVRKKVDYKITTPDDRQYEVISTSIQTSPGDIDLAVVKFKATNKYTTAKLDNCNPIEGGMDLYVAGFPAPDEMITSVTDYQGALADFNRAIEINPNFASAYLARGELKVSLNSGGASMKSQISNLQGALTDYNRAIEISPSFAAYADRAWLKGDKLNDLQGALADFKRAIQINSDNSSIYRNRALLKAGRLNDAQGAVSDYNRAIQINPKFYYYQERGELKYRKLNDLGGALADYNRALQIQPNYTGMHDTLAFIKYDLGDLSGAIQSWRKYLLAQESGSFHFYNYESKLALAIALYKQGQESEAYTLATAAIREEKRLTDLKFLRKQYKWSEIILKDATIFFRTPTIRSS